MSFFERYNVQKPRAQHLKLSEIKLCVPMTMTKMQEAPKQVGVLTQLNAKTSMGEIFFYMSARDHAKMLGQDYSFLTLEIDNKKSPFIVIAKTKDGITVILQHCEYENIRSFFFCVM